MLEYGWAYGTGGTALHGKELVLAVSPGADNYGREKFAKYTVHELLRPLQAMSRLVGMDFKVPFITVGASSIGKAEIAQQAKKYDTYLHETALPTLGDFD
ncbi:hypothetical protein LCB40_14150 [Lactobacillus corticis]|uniref:Flavodoxin-like fold domain-containing protein n=1 Tax=Lactobacillus corticis TaxID=2201249 RepID=A0A916QKW4_9LACO|nr:hypothetical protein LCB40_14150 [Lactobacillus corticis]